MQIDPEILRIFLPYIRNRFGFHGNYKVLKGRTELVTFNWKHFPKFHNFLKFSKISKTILVNVHFQFCFDQPIKF